MSNKVIVLAAIFAFSGGTEASATNKSCRLAVKPEQSVLQIRYLPTEIREDLISRIDPKIADFGSTLRNSDAPNPSEKLLPVSKFSGAHLIGNVFYVSYEIALISSARTIGYVRNREGRFERSPLLYFGGNPCQAINAALNGVSSPGGFNF